MENRNKKDHYLNKLFDKERLNPKEFAESLGFDRVDRIYNVISGRNNVSIELARIIQERYPYTNIDWLQTGKGEMLSNNKNQETITMSREVFDTIKMLSQTVLSQQETIANLASDQKKKVAVLQEGNAGVANVG